MLGKSLASPLLTSNHVPGPRMFFTLHGVLATRPSVGFPSINSHSWMSSINSRSKTWVLKSTAAQAETTTLTEEDKESWESCREALRAFSFTTEEADKMLGKAFGLVHSPYWGEERKMVVPRLDAINETLHYLRSLGLSDDDLVKVLKKFPEVLGCDLEAELRNNVQILEKQWGIKGKPLRNLLLRNPKALGYNVDCKGDCIAQCTRCWARF